MVSGAYPPIGVVLVHILGEMLELQPARLRHFEVVAPHREQDGLRMLVHLDHVELDAVIAAERGELTTECHRIGQMRFEYIQGDQLDAWHNLIIGPLYSAG